MDFSSINWLAVIVCVVVSMISGSLWYNPKTFFEIWWKGIGKTDADRPGGKGSMAMTWVLTVLSSFVQAVFMALMVECTGQAFRWSDTPFGYVDWPYPVVWIHRANVHG